MTIALFISCYFSKKLTRVSLGHKDLKKHFGYVYLIIAVLGIYLRHPQLQIHETILKKTTTK